MNLILALIPPFLVLYTTIFPIAFYPGRSIHTATAITFAIKVSRLGDHVTMSYPDNHVWREFCIERWGKENDKYNPGDFIDWDRVSCWKPAHRTEDLKVESTTLRVKGWLWIDDDRDPLITPMIQVRPEEGTTNGSK